MASQQEINRSYSKLAQIYNSFHTKYPIAHVTKCASKKEGDINYKIPPNSCICSSEPKLIGCTALHIAAMKHEPEIFDILVKEGADFTIQDEEGRTALHCLVNKPNFSKGFAIKILLMHLSLADPTNPCDKDGLSHFHIACKYNRTEVVKFFLSNEIPVDLPVNFNAKKFAGYSPLHFAVENMAWQVMNALLKQNANMNAKDARGLTPLHLLLEEKIKTFDSYKTKGDKVPNEMIVVMDEAMNSLLDSNDVDDIGLTHFHVACTQHDTSMVEYFLEQNVDVNQQVNTNSPIRPGYTALHFAVHCNIKSVKMLLKKKANCELKDANGVTPLQLMLEQFTREDLQTIVTQNWNRLTFSDSSTQFVEFYNALDDAGLMKAYLMNLNDIMKTVNKVEYGMPRWVGCTLLHLAVMLCKDWETIAVCISQGLNLVVDVQDAYGSTPVHLAFRMNRLDIVKILILCCEGRNITDDDGLSYLHIACALQKAERVRLFSKDINIQLPYNGATSYGLITPGSTPLHVAMASGNIEIINMLLQSGLNFEAVDANGLTPLHRFFRTKPLRHSLLKNKLLTDEVLKGFGLTLLHVAIYSEELNIQQYMSANNIEAVIKCEDSASVFFPYDGCTPLLMAMKSNARIEIVASLLKYGADFLMKNERGDSPLFLALTQNPIHKVMTQIIARLQQNNKLQLKMEEMSGITMLHIACRMVNCNDVDRLTSKGANVNARINSDCLVWPGCTPLHVLMEAIRYRGVDDDVCQITKMLLAAGADVSAMDENNQTPIHLSLREIYIKSDDKKVVAALLENLRVFDVNPVGQNGMSHFHAACLVNKVEVVKSFLESGVNVNQPIDFFANDFAGETPLHLAVDRRTEMPFDPESKEKTVRLLLEHGADVKAEDSLGQTAFHKAVRLTGHHLDIWEMLARHGATLDTRNTFDQTPLELLLKSDNVSVEKIKFFEKWGCRLNDTNSTTEEGYIAMLISLKYHPKYIEEIVFQQNIHLLTQCFQVMVDAVDSMIPDSVGRNLLHHILTTSNPIPNIFSYNELIKRFQAAGVDIDLQDNEGRTALHIALPFGRVEAIKDLLENGADVNVLDVTNRSVLHYATVKYYADREDHECYSQDRYKKLIEQLLSHMTILHQMNLELHEINIIEKERAFRDILHGAAYYVHNETEVLRIAKTLLVVKQPKLFLMDFLSEMGKGLIGYPFMSDERREKVDAFFCNYKGDFKDLFALQYRKAVKRVKLVELTMDCLGKISNLAVPILCIEMIIRYLKNSELRNFIKAITISD